MIPSGVRLKAKRRQASQWIKSEVPENIGSYLSKVLSASLNVIRKVSTIEIMLIVNI